MPETLYRLLAVWSAGLCRKVDGVRWSGPWLSASSLSWRLRAGSDWLEMEGGVEVPLGGAVPSTWLSSLEVSVVLVERSVRKLARDRLRSSRKLKSEGDI
jgi:hypothetical protein